MDGERRLKEMIDIQQRRCYYLDTFQYRNALKNPEPFLTGFDKLKGGSKSAKHFKTHFKTLRVELSQVFFNLIVEGLGLSEQTKGGIGWTNPECEPKMKEEDFAIVKCKSRAILINMDKVTNCNLLRDSIFHEIAQVLVWDGNEKNIANGFLFKEAEEKIKKRFTKLNIEF